jgi:alpha-1,3-mannosyltransferase
MGQEKLQVIENGVDIEKYANQGATALQPSLIYFGRWSINKGLLPALELFAALHRQHPEWRFTIAGREYDHTAAELQQKINSLGLQGAVQLAPNPSDEEIRQLIRQSSYFLCLSRHEGFGIAPIEAMSAGLTPILSDIPPFRRLVDESGLGSLIELDSAPSASINMLVQLHAQGDAGYQVRRAAAMEFAQRYAWPQVADRYLALYEQLGRRP